MSDYEFCPECEVTMDLHDGEDSCDYAAHKVRELDMINGFLWSVVTGR